MTKASDLREFDSAELETKLAEARKELFNLRFQAATGRLDNNARVSQLRREIARVLTVQRAQELELADSMPASESAGDEVTEEQ